MSGTSRSAQGNLTIDLGYGGYQEARGADKISNNHFYVENVRLMAPHDLLMTSSRLLMAPYGSLWLLMASYDSS